MLRADEEAGRQAAESARRQLPGPTSLPARGRVEVVRYIRSNRILNLFGKKITLAEDQTHQYVTAIIKVRVKKVLVATINGEIIHEGVYQLSRIGVSVIPTL